MQLYPKKNLPEAWIGLAFCATFSLLAWFGSKQLHYPIISIQSPDLTTTIISQPSSTLTACEASLQNQLQNIRAACPNCVTSQSKCGNNLTHTQKLLATTAPLPHYAALLPNGFVLYEAKEPSVARLACLQSEQQSHHNGFLVRCIAPNEARFNPTNPLVAKWTMNELWAFLAILSALFVLSLLAKNFSHAIAYKALALSRRQKQWLLVISDILILEASLYFSLAIRSESLLVAFDQLAYAVFISPILALPIFWKMGLYNAVVRYLGLQAFLAIVQAVTLYSVLTVAWLFFSESHPLSIGLALIHGMLTLLMIGASRAVARRWLSKSQNQGIAQTPRKRAIIYGAGSAGVQLALALSQSREILPVSFIDDDANLHGKHIAGLTVYSRADLANLVINQQISEVLLAIPSSSRAVRNAIISELEKLPVQVRTLPGLAHLAQGKVKTSDLREVEIEDLLGRDPVPPKIELLESNIKHKVVMVTGAGGSIGSELCRQISQLNPKRLVLFELNEFALYSIEQELLALQPAIQSRLFPILGSVTDTAKVDLVLKHFEVETVFHAAAYKHVPMVEKNPCAGAFNNILGTWHTAIASQRNHIDTFVLVSTDKAVRPTNTMGTTKRLAELILQALNQVTTNRTRFVMVRFGNVLGSSGSVLPVFKEQIRNGGPVTVTDPRIIRYFMTIPEAAQLVIQAGAMGQGGDVFVLDMGEPVQIFDMAKKMIHLSGLSLRDETNPGGDIEISFTGLRPGEKLYEELLIGDNVSSTNHPRVMRASEKFLEFSEVERLVNKVELACDQNDSEKLREILVSAVSEFEPQCGNEDLLA
jgi:UDP-N-acetylglucosamine 4,6-dehydratase